MTDGHNVTPAPVDKPKSDAERVEELVLRLTLAARKVAGRPHAASQLRRLEEAVTIVELML